MIICLFMTGREKNVNDAEVLSSRLSFLPENVITVLIAKSEQNKRILASSSYNRWHAAEWYCEKDAVSGSRLLHFSAACRHLG